MNTLVRKKKQWSKYVCGVFLALFLVFAPVSQDLSSQKAEAFLGGGDPATIALWIKEYVLDGIVYALINEILESIVESLTEWVQSGFRDGPGFITDLDGFLLDTADRAAGEFLLLDGPLEFLCSPFKLDVRLALQASYLDSGAYYKPECSLTDAVDNVDAFLDGDFSQGGWDGWASMTLNPRNNLYGAIFDAQGEFEIAIKGAKNQEVFHLDFGSGFFGVEECEEVEEGPPDCQRVTPGSIVQEGLSDTLNLGNERLTIADEIDEFIGALIAQLLSSVFNNEGGLARFSPSSQNAQYSPAIQDAIDASREAANTVNQNTGERVEEIERLREEGGGCLPGYINVGGVCQPVGYAPGGGCLPGYEPDGEYCRPAGGGTISANGCVGTGCTPCTPTATRTCGVGVDIFGNTTVNGEYVSSCQIGGWYSTSVLMTENQCGMVYNLLPTPAYPSHVPTAVAQVCGGSGGQNSFEGAIDIYVCGYPGAIPNPDLNEELGIEEDHIYGRPPELLSGQDSMFNTCMAYVNSPTDYAAMTYADCSAECEAGVDWLEENEPEFEDVVNIYVYDVNNPAVWGVTRACTVVYSTISEPPLTVIDSECNSWPGYKYVDDAYGERCIWVGFDTSGDGCPPGSVFSSNGMCISQTFGPGCPSGTSEETFDGMLFCMP